jgi:hypothetical protein
MLTTRPMSPLMFTSVGEDMIYNNNSHITNFTRQNGIQNKEDICELELFMINLNLFLKAHDIHKDVKDLNCFFDYDRRIYFFISVSIDTYSNSLTFEEVIKLIDSEMNKTNNYLHLYNMKKIETGLNDIKTLSYDFANQILKKKAGLL